MRSVAGITLRLLLFCTSFFILHARLYAQVELEPWGNITSIRVDGQPMTFESSLRVVYKDWSALKVTGRERQRPKYERNGARQMVTTEIDSIAFTEKVEDAGKGMAHMTVDADAHAGRSVDGLFVAFSLPDEYFSKGFVTSGTKKLSIGQLSDRPVSLPAASSIQITAPDRKIGLSLKEPVSLLIRKEQNSGISNAVLYLPLHSGSIRNGDAFHQDLSITVTGTIDRQPVTVQLDTKSTGRVFDGLGGNFRLQNPKTDPQVIDYCLQNLRVAWGRVEMPWRFWQPEMSADPIAEAKAGRLNENVRQAMEMAQRLGKMGMPVILTAWAPPAWAVVGTPKFSPGPDGVWGNPIDHSREQQIYKSIADYIQYLKDQYSVEISMFSFNESDLGINIRQTGEEHAALIKGLGAYFALRGLKTKMLLGDNSDATTYRFIDPALNDPATYPYIGAISFHSWRGWEKETLQHWADAATRLHLPLLVGEGSIDAAAWNYPAIFEEPVYAMDEINLYVRLLSICQPASILQWQLTADYSPLAGGGIFGNNEPVHPTQRFWNLKQLAATPEHVRAMEATCNGSFVSCAAMGDEQAHKYAIHLVNNGSARTAIISGLPADIESLRVFTTNKENGMKEGKRVAVKRGKASIDMDAASFITAIAGTTSH